jgi:hypothetical protein
LCVGKEANRGATIETGRRRKSCLKFFRKKEHFQKNGLNFAKKPFFCEFSTVWAVEVLSPVIYGKKVGKKIGACKKSHPKRKVVRFQSTKIPKHEDSKARRFQSTKIPKHEDSKARDDSNPR